MNARDIVSPGDLRPNAMSSSTEIVCPSFSASRNTFIITVLCQLQADPCYSDFKDRSRRVKWNRSLLGQP